ncbi:hypothetical protein HUJ04_013517 [Dendroctonus ponderosae]|nr:hypothetical protein HUJ04_013517 [Dendroctonus ponderosae]KAH1006119.1 hypothetical protein HUJ05_006884 [Dendroctonus ponderosae]
MFEKTLADLWQSVEYSNAWWICLFSVCAVLLCLFAARRSDFKYFWVQKPFLYKGNTLNPLAANT